MRPAKFKKKLGTRITNADMIKFQETFSARMSGDMDGLKRKRADAKDKVLPPPSRAFFRSPNALRLTLFAREKRTSATNVHPAARSKRHHLHSRRCERTSLCRFTAAPQWYRPHALYSAPCFVLPAAAKGGIVQARGTRQSHVT